MSFAIFPIFTVISLSGSLSGHLVGTAMIFRAALSGSLSGNGYDF